MTEASDGQAHDPVLKEDEIVIIAGPVPSPSAASSDQPLLDT